MIILKAQGKRKLSLPDRDVIHNMIRDVVLLIPEDKQDT